MAKRGIIVKAVVFDGQDKVLLIRRSKTAPRRPLEWDLPGGIMDDDESYQDVCLRELREETGLEDIKEAPRLSYAESALDVVGPAEVYDVTQLYFVVQTAATEVHLSYEHDDAIWVTLDKAIELIKYDKQLRALTHIQQARQT